jgi:DNA-binding MarR family transcriptional regulator
VETDRAQEARTRLEDEVMGRFDAMMARVTAWHAPELLAVDVTMAQLKALYLVSTNGALHVSALAELLGVTLSTGSGLADRLVEQGLLDRRHDPADRRHVVLSASVAGVALLDRMRELSTQRVRSLLAPVSDGDLAAFGRVLASFTEQLATTTPAPQLPPSPPATAHRDTTKGTR